MGKEEVEGDASDDEFDEDLVGFEPAQLLAAVERELERAIASSPANASARLARERIARLPERPAPAPGAGGP